MQTRWLVRSALIVTGLGLVTSAGALPAAASHEDWHEPTRSPDGPVSIEIEDFEGGTASSVNLVGYNDPLFTGIWVDTDAVSAAFLRTLSLGVADSVAGNSYSESRWADSGLDASALAKVQWMLSLGSAPFESAWDGGSLDYVEPVRDGLVAAGLDAGIANSLAPEEIVAALQAAIWHVMDDVDLDPDPALTDPEVLALYDFLISSANTGEEPPGNGWLELSLTPEHFEDGVPGELMGPFTLATNVDVARISSHFNDGAAEPMTVLDGDGNEVPSGTTQPDGTELYVTVPADVDWTDSGGLTASARRTVSGMVMTGDGPPVIMLNYPEEMQVRSHVAWTISEPETTEPPSASDSGKTPSTSPADATADAKELPDTGIGAGTLLAAAAMLIVVGAALLVVNRRRQSSNI